MLEPFLAASFSLALSPVRPRSDSLEFHRWPSPLRGFEAVVLPSGNGMANVYFRGDGWDRVKERNRDKLQRVIDAGRVTVFLRSTVREIRHDVVVIEAEGAPTILPVDNVVVRIGGEAPYALLERSGVRIVEKEVPAAGRARTA